MYSDDNIGLDIYNKYYEFVNLLKLKNTSSSKLDDLIKLLMQVNNMYENLNEDEKKMIKNIISISKSIIRASSDYYLKTKEKLLRCEELIKELEEKQKEPIKK